MIKLKRLAADVIEESLRLSEVPGHVGLRLSRMESGLGLFLDTPQQSDTIIHFKERVLLIVNASVEADIGDAVIDVACLEGQNELVIRGNGR